MCFRPTGSGCLRMNSGTSSFTRGCSFFQKNGAGAGHISILTFLEVDDEILSLNFFQAEQSMPFRFEASGNVFQRFAVIE